MNKLNKLLAFCVLSLAFSCINLSVLSQKDKHFLLEVKNTKIIGLDASQWAVGPKGKQRVDRGVRVKVSLPQLKKEDAALLRKQRGIDSVLLKISREVRGALITVGYLSVPINEKGLTTKEVFFFLDYYAAGIRSIHTRYICPPFDHNFKVYGLDIVDQPKKMESMIISSQYERSVKDGHHSRFLYAG